MPSKEELEELGVSKENYSYLQKLYNLNKKFMHLKEAQKGEPLTSFKKYKEVIFFKKNSQKIIIGQEGKKKKKTQEAHGCGTLF